MPLRRTGSVARYTRIAAHPLEVRPAWKTKAALGARLTLLELGKAADGLLQIESTLPTGLGLGSSTADVVAAVRAVCSGYGVTPEARQVARIAVAAETAVDPLMFEDEMLLFAHREGRVLESWGDWLPVFEVLSVDMDPGRGGVDTLSAILPDYSEDELSLLEDLTGRARDAFRRQDRAATASVATASAALNQKFLPMRRFSAIRSIAERYGALGVQISHSGTLVGVLFEPEHIAHQGHFLPRIRAELESLGAQVLDRFVTGGG